MANHVSACVEIQFKSEEDTTRFVEWLKYETDPEKYPENSNYFSRLEACSTNLVESLFDNVENTRDWWIENLGAKWWYLDDVSIGDTDVYLNWTSAWDFTEGLLWKLSDFLRDVIPDTTIQGTFEDEGYGFIGAFASNQQFRDVEYFYPDEDFFEDPEYKDEDDCWTEAFYDQMTDKKEEMLNEVLAFIEQLPE